MSEETYNESINKIKTAIYGEEVRNSIANAIEKCYEYNQGDVIEESIRGIGDISNSSSDISDCNDIPVNRIAGIYNSGVDIANKPTDNFAGEILCIADDYNQSLIRTQIAIDYGGKLYIRGYNEGISPKWNSWVLYGFKSSENFISKTFGTPEMIEGNANFDTYVNPGSFTFFANVNNASDANGIPNGFQTGTLVVFSGDNSRNLLAFQIAYYDSGNLKDSSPRCWMRSKYADTWYPWRRISLSADSDASFVDIPIMSLSCFKTIGVVGDSFASGLCIYDEGEGTVANERDYWRSWIQILARQYGFEGYNFSENGLSTRTWLTHERGKALLESSPAMDLYLLCLGINDSAIKIPIGSVSDVGTENDTFYGNYGKIVNIIKTKAPDAKIIFFTFYSDGGAYNEAIVELAKYFNLPYIITNDDPYLASNIYKGTFWMQGHPTAVGYSYMATEYAKLISNCIVNNAAYFNRYPFTEESLS